METTQKIQRVCKELEYITNTLKLNSESPFLKQLRATDKLNIIAANKAYNQQRRLDCLDSLRYGIFAKHKV